MEFVAERCFDRMETVYRLKINSCDLDRATFDERDHLLMADCSGEDATISDKLLALEMIARRIEEGRK